MVGDGVHEGFLVGAVGEIHFFSAKRSHDLTLGDARCIQMWRVVEVFVANGMGWMARKVESSQDVLFHFGGAGDQELGWQG